MPITQTDFAQALSRCDAPSLAVVMDAADMRVRDGDAPSSMGKRVASALWWRTHTPVGKVALADDLGGIIRRVARKAKIELPESSDDLELLEALTQALVPEDELDLSQLDPAIMKRLRTTHWAEWFGVGTAGTAVGGKFVAATYLKWTAPVVDWLPYVPKIGPILVGARTVSNTVVKVAGPIGIGVSLLTLNSVLGADLDRALPLLLGSGLALRNATPPPEADTDPEADAPPTDETGSKSVLEPEPVQPDEVVPPMEDILEPEVLDAEFSAGPISEADVSKE